MSKSISQVCREAADLIRTEGFTRGNGGWHGIGGWCIEGALGRVLGISRTDRDLSVLVNQSEAGQAINAYLGLGGRPLMGWNDGAEFMNGYLLRHRSADEVIAALEAVAEEQEQVRVDKGHRLREAVAKFSAALYDLTGAFTKVGGSKPVLAWNPEVGSWVPVAPVVPDFVPDEFVEESAEDTVKELVTTG